MYNETRKLVAENLAAVLQRKSLRWEDDIISKFTNMLVVEIENLKSLHTLQLAAISTQANSNTKKIVDKPLGCSKEIQTQALFDVNTAIHREIALQTRVQELEESIRLWQTPMLKDVSEKESISSFGERASKARLDAAVAQNNPAAQKDHDPVNHPSHYTSDPSGVECITITRHRNFNVGNAIKYLWRAGLKDSDKTVEDLRKAIFYIEDEINRLQLVPNKTGHVATILGTVA